jgi:hypothetical protein
MKKQNFYLSDFWYGALLVISVWVIAKSFSYSDVFRAYNSTGGEIFTLFLPVLIIRWKQWSRVNKRRDNRKFFEERY